MSRTPPAPLATSVLALLAIGCPAQDDLRLRVSGTIEADDVRVAPLLGGRILEVLAGEGERVEVGQVLVRLDPSDLALQIEQARAAIEFGRAQLALVLSGARPEDLSAAEEMARQAEVAEAAAASDLARIRGLAEGGAATSQQVDALQVRYDVASSQKRAADRQLAKVRKGARPEEIEVARAAVRQAEAALQVLEKKLADCVVAAPERGTVVHRLVEPGEVVGPGATLFVVEDLDTVRLTVFVPETDLGRVRVGDAVPVWIDSHPDRSFAGKVTRIRDRAEFTPRNVQTRDEREKLVFAVEIELANPEGYLKPGLPADADLALPSTPASSPEPTGG